MKKTFKEESIEIQKYLRRIHNLFITNKLLLQLEALSNCDNFTVTTILFNYDVLTVIINQTIPRKMSKYFLFKIGLSREINKDSFNSKSIANFSKLAL